MFEDVLKEKMLTVSSATRRANCTRTPTPQDIRQRREKLLQSPLLPYGRALRLALGDAKENHWVSRTFGSSEPLLVISDVDRFTVYSEDHALTASIDESAVPATHRLDLQIKLRTGGPNAGKVALDMRIYSLGEEIETIRRTRRLAETCEDAVAFLEDGIADVVLALHGECLADVEASNGPGR